MIKLIGNQRLGEIIRFILVGFLATAIHYIIYYVLLNMLGHNISYTIGYVVSFIFNFYLIITFYLPCKAIVTAIDWLWNESSYKLFHRNGIAQCNDIFWCQCYFGSIAGICHAGSHQFFASQIFDGN